jgi:hypothetical protein
MNTKTREKGEKEQGKDEDSNDGQKENEKKVGGECGENENEYLENKTEETDETGKGVSGESEG